MKRFAAVVVSLFFAALTPLVAQVQDPPTSKQELARQKFKELDERMQKLQSVLAKSNPEESKVLKVGTQWVQEAKIHDDMAKIRTMLDGERWDEALEQMKVVRTNLTKLLELLQNRNMDLAKLMEQIARLSAFRDRVDTLAKEEGKEKDASARTEDLQKQLEAIDKAKAQLEQILGEQKQLRADTNQAGLGTAADATKPLANKEGDVKDKTDQLQKDLAAIEKKAEELSKPAATPGKPAAPSPAPAGKSSGGAGAASKSMGQAQKQLNDNKPEPSLKDQDQAIQQLEGAKKDLEQLAEETRRELQKLPFEQQAKAQEQTKTDTDTLSKDMEKSDEKGEMGEGKQTPGKKRVQAAVPKQKAAAGTLKEYKPAKQKQQDAKDDLDAAKDELDEALAQLRQQLQDEVLRALEERFAAMLAKQKDLSAITKVVDKTRATVLTSSGDLPTGLVEKCQQIASGETDLEVEASDALKLLQEDATTAVFPEVVSDLKDQLHGLAKECRGNQTGKPVQTHQAEVEDTLALLINALRRAIEAGEGNCKGQCNGQPPLVPISAELKMIRYLQERVNKRTTEYEKVVAADQRETDDAKADAKDLSTKQAKVRDLTRKLAVKLNHENNAEEGGK